MLMQDLIGEEKYSSPNQSQSEKEITHTAVLLYPISFIVCCNSKHVASVYAGSHFALLLVPAAPLSVYIHTGHEEFVTHEQRNVSHGGQSAQTQPQKRTIAGKHLKENKIKNIAVIADVAYSVFQYKITYAKDDSLVKLFL